MQKYNTTFKPADNLKEKIEPYRKDGKDLTNVLKKVLTSVIDKSIPIRHQ